MRATILGSTELYQAQQIVREIEARISVVPRYSAWTIGITNDPDRRFGEHGRPTCWTHWKASSEVAARAIEQHFLEKGMKGGDGGGYNPTYVYVF